MPDKASPKYGMWMQAHDRILAATDLVTGEPVPFEQKEVKGKSMLLMTLSIPDGVPDYIVKLDVEPLREPGGPAVEIGVVEPGTADATSR